MNGNLAIKFDNGSLYEFPVDEHKLKKDGTFKQVPNNNTEERWVDPIRDTEDIKRVSIYLLNKARNSNRKDAAMGNWRNWLLFVIGINVGLRVSDLINLKWSHIYERDMTTFVQNINKKEKKTGKIKDICPNVCIKRAVQKYLESTEIIPAYNEYIFLNARTGNRVTDAVVEKMVKDFAENCMLNGNYNTHSLRKTYAYQKYMNYVKCGDPLALVKVQSDLNHRNSSDTARYLGITREEKIESSERLGDYLVESLGF